MTTGIEMLGRDVVDERTGRTVGRVADMLFDDECRRVVGVVAERRLSRRRTVIGAAAVRAYGPRVMVESIETTPVSSDEPVATASTSVEGKPVVTSSGRVLGTVVDVVFNEADGRVTGFDVRDWAPGRSCRRRRLLPVNVPLAVGDVIIVPHLRRHRATAPAAAG